MECRVLINQGGLTRVRVGHPVATGPRTLRLLLTQPYPLTGRIVEIPVDSIESILETDGSGERIERAT